MLKDVGDGIRSADLSWEAEAAAIDAAETALHEYRFCTIEVAVRRAVMAATAAIASFK
jgi:hypothetical protein